MEQTEKKITGESTPDISIDIRKWGFKFLSYWWLFLICLLISVPSGYLYLRYANYEYVTKAKVLIKGAGKVSALSELSILGESLGIASGGKDLNSEIEIFSSRPILTATVKKIGAEVAYYRIGQFKNTELYNSAPFAIDSFLLKEGRRRISFFIEIGYYEEFKFKSNVDDEGKTYILGQPFENQSGSFLISTRQNSKLVPGLYLVNISDPEDVAGSYKRKLEIEVVGAQNSNILEFNITDRSAEKSVDFINNLFEVYNQSQINENRVILENTLRFIIKRIEMLESELDQIETEIEEFKSKNSIITQDVNSSLGFVLPELRSSLEQLAAYELEKELLSSVSLDLVDASSNDKLIPINVANASQGLGDLINQYNKFILERRRLKKNITNASPVLLNLENEIDDYKKLILVSLENIIRNLEIPISQIEKEIQQLEGDITKVPTVEKLFLEKLRRRTIKEELFVSLLQKREETELSMAITTANTRVIESAKSSGGPVYPQTKLIRLGTVLLGLFIPLIIIFIIALFENKIDSEATLIELTSVPIIGRIPRIKGEEKIVAEKMKNSVIMESFRLLRTNLNYMNLGNEKQIIMTTSSMSGEGKSIISINLALTIAQTKKKVILVDLDLRKPKIATYLNAGFGQGISNYLAGQCDLSSVVNKHDQISEFSFITSGPKPPNPAEMLQSEKIVELLDDLKKEFDYIILDLPPMGLVADALLLRKFVTNTLFVVRHKYTKKTMIKHLENLHINEELIKPSIVLNDIKMFGGEYGAYNSTYGSGYYSEK